MIKAEIISHEGNPGPNWLDRCRSAATPGRLTVFIAVLLIGASTAYALLQSNDAEQPAATASQQNSYPDDSPLVVKPLQQQSVQTETDLPELQSASGGDTAPSASNEAASGLSAPITPSLNAEGANAKLQSSQYKESVKADYTVRKKRKNKSSSQEFEWGSKSTSPTRNKQ